MEAATDDSYPAQISIFLCAFTRASGTFAQSLKPRILVIFDTFNMGIDVDTGLKPAATIRSIIPAMVAPAVSPSQKTS